MNAEQIFQKLGGRRLGPGKFLCHCCCHEDSSPSLSVSEKSDGGVLLHCHGGCKNENIFKKINSPEFIANGNNNQKPNQVPYVQKKVVQIHEYIYQTWEGIDSLKVVRKDFEDGSKTFSQFRSENNQWIPGGNKDVAPFGYSKWKDLSETIFCVEGEKVQKAINSLGLLATCIPGGASAWRSDYAKAFHGKEVIILPDNDEPGKKFALNAFNDISKEAKSVRIIELPDLGPKEDSYDWLAKGHTKDELMKLIKVGDHKPKTKDRSKIFRLSEVVETKIEFAIEPYFPLGMISLVSGDPGCGKSTFIAFLSEIVSNGKTLNTNEVSSE